MKYIIISEIKYIIIVGPKSELGWNIDGSYNLVHVEERTFGSGSLHEKSLTTPDICNRLTNEAIAMTMRFTECATSSDELGLELTSNEWVSYIFYGHSLILIKFFIIFEHLN